MKTQSISRQNLEEIHKIACKSWKEKLENYATRSPFSNEISFTESEINEMFDASDNKQKDVLKKFFKRASSIIEQINSFEDACEHLNINPEDVFSSTDSNNDIAFKKLKIIIKALNDGWYPDWNNANEYKYYNWFDMRDGSFSYCGTNDYLYSTFVASALLLKSRDLAIHAAKIAFNEYKAYMI